MIKFQAHYRVTVYSKSDTVTITDPITCHFNVTRGVMSDNNRATIELYNLSPSTRKKIFQDVFTFNPDDWKYVHLEAGYGDTLSLIFKGRILQAYSKKTGGQTDIITEIQAQALDIFDCDCHYQFKAGTSKRDAFQTMASSMPNVKLANMGKLDGIFQTDTTFDGNAMNCLNQLTGGNTFVDNGNLNCIMLNEVVAVPVPVIKDDNCLLETPMRRDANLEVKMLFEPTIITGQLLQIESHIYEKLNVNGQYKVLGFTHDCTISGSQGGTRTTTVNLYVGVYLPNAADYVAQSGGFVEVKGFDVSPVNPVPLAGKWLKPAIGYISSPFGKRDDPFKKSDKNKSNNKKSPHYGIDIAAAQNSKIFATQNGTVMKNLGTAQSGGYGNYIELDHGIVNGKRVTSRYGHMVKQSQLSIGRNVKQGDVIGYVGSTGRSTGPHLHFEIRENGRPVNPRNYIG